MKTERPITVNFRVPRKLHRAFFQKVRVVGTPSEVLRELLLAFVEGRVIVTPLSVTQPVKEE